MSNSAAPGISFSPIPFYRLGEDERLDRCDHLPGFLPPYKHNRLAQAAVSSLSEEAAKRRDEKTWNTDNMRPFSTGNQVVREAKKLPVLRWKRSDLCKFLNQYLSVQWGPDYHLEFLYSGGSGLKLALGQEVYAKICDTDVKVFLTGVSDGPKAYHRQILEYCVSLVSIFVRGVLATHYKRRTQEIPMEWVESYLPPAMIHHIIDPAKGLYRTSMPLGEDEDWLFILDLDTARLHTTTGKSLLCPLFKNNNGLDLLVSLEGGVEEAIEAAKLGIIDTAAPQELYGKGPLSLWELITHGHTPRNSQVGSEFTARIATICQTNPAILGQYCESHRKGDDIGAIAFLVTGFFDIATTPNVSVENKPLILEQIRKVLLIYVKRGEKVVQESSLFLSLLVRAILDHPQDEGLIVATGLFLMNLYPHEAHLAINPSRLASPDDEERLSTYQDLVYLRLPRRVLIPGGKSFPDQCYIGVPKDLQEAWRLLSSPITSKKAQLLWAYIGTVLTKQDLETVVRFVKVGDYGAIATHFLGEHFSDMGFSTLFAGKENVRQIVELLIASFRNSLHLIEGNTVERIAIELKLMLLQIVLLEKSLPSEALVRSIRNRLVALLGRVLLSEGKNRVELVIAIKYLLNK